ncbi:hypothetical protein GcM3_044002 [Golovinomyces cichoracearum]|uniref:Uncharacterized protein n=1 Tax=Golovinomyces cichoracearum TaxID=62708 RepID=A0A420J1G5_9PEZI|nr:hypothetical protein GcM3_044002 [Golovinomyces cichoracearum]
MVTHFAVQTLNIISKVITSTFLCIISPFVYLGRNLIMLLLLPIRALEKFEVLLTYLCTAAIVGVIIGCTLYFSSTIIVSLFDGKFPENMNKKDAKIPRHIASSQTKNGRNWQTVELNNIQERRRGSWASVNKCRGHDDRGLLGQTIIEEDSDF